MHKIQSYSLLLAGMVMGLGGAAGPVSAQLPVDSALAAYIMALKAIDDHAHPLLPPPPLPGAPADSDYDALPLDVIPPFPLPVRTRPENPEWIAAWRALWGYAYDDASEAHLKELRATKQRIQREQGEGYDAWVLDRLGIEVMLANRVTVSAGLLPPRFRWVSFADALMLPLSTRGEAALSPDRQGLYPKEDRLLLRYLAALGAKVLPATLDEYVARVLTATLERYKREGAVGIKFEAAYLRSLDFDEADTGAARRIYARYVRAGVPTHAEYKTLQDYLFRVIAREAGRLGLPVQIHVTEGAGGFYRAAGGSNPLLLESAFNDPALRKTAFIIVHGGWPFTRQTGSMLGKPNVYADLSYLGFWISPRMLAGVIRDWLTLYPEKVLFGTDASGFAEDIGWEEAGWMSGRTVRQALALALTGMLRDGEITRERAQELAEMVIRKNAIGLYGAALR